MPFEPNISTEALEDLLVVASKAQPGEWGKALSEGLAALCERFPKEAKELRAVSLLIGDLERIGGRFAREKEGLVFSPPDFLEGSAEETKRKQRAAQLAVRAAQLAEPSVRDFFRRMETPRFFGGKRVSVLDLVDNGSELAAELSHAALAPPSRRGELLDGIIKPVFQVATAKDLCEHTGLPLLDIWRYFRHTWTLEYRPTPGRTFFLLIRNAARPMAPVIGIASLANAVMQHKKRDGEKFLKWSLQAVTKELREHPEQWSQYRAALLGTLRAALKLVRQDDLRARANGVRGEALERLLGELADEADEAREKELRVRAEKTRNNIPQGPLKQLPLNGRNKVDWKAASESSLFTAKRARLLAGLLFSRRVLEKTPLAMSSEQMQEFLDSADGARALSWAAREIRKVGLASRLLDLNTCGAVPPYRELLGGKLVALAAASADFASAYQERYGKQSSEIASQVAGRRITREANICAVTTTSIYSVASSQYNRLKLRVPTPTGDFTVHWREFAETEGQGTAHLSGETITALVEVCVKKNDWRNVNNLFGEGQSPRLRQAREGLVILGLAKFLKHYNPRIMYGLELFEGAVDCLRFNRPPTGKPAPFTAIARAWRDRWLANRVLNREILDRVARQGPETVRAELAPPEGPQRTIFSLIEASAPAKARESSEPTEGELVFMRQQRIPSVIQSLYRAVAACAEHHDDAVVKEIHIETPVEGFLQEFAPGRICFVTGDPGDGKTHLLRKLLPALRGAKVDYCLDANETPEEELINLIDVAWSKRRGLAVAINEGVLAHLLLTAGAQPWALAARDQMLRPLVYRSTEAAAASPRDARVLVLDLNLRNNLSPQIVTDALTRMLSIAGPCDGCPIQTCDLQGNVGRLVKSASARQRLVSLLDLTARGGVHATMRDLQGFLAFLLFGGRDCEATRRAGGGARPYWHNAFVGGRGALFDAVRALDPVINTSPEFDDVLWRDADTSTDWSAPWPEKQPRGEPLTERLERFRGQKRRALFEHKQGGDLIQRRDDATEQEWKALQKGGSQAVRTLVRLINHFLSGASDQGELLHLWTTHRFDANVHRYATAVASVPAQSLEVLKPRLRGEIERAFPDYLPDHVLLSGKDAPLDAGLVVDRALFRVLHDASHGLTPALRRGEPETRVAAFVDKLASKHRDVYEDDEIAVRLIDRETGDEERVVVSVSDRRFIPPR